MHGEMYANAKTAAYAATASIRRFCGESLIVMTAQGGVLCLFDAGAQTLRQKHRWVWSLGERFLPALIVQGRTIWIVDAHGYGKRFIVRADEILTAFVELERAIHEFAVSLILKS